MLDLIKPLFIPRDNDIGEDRIWCMMGNVHYFSKMVDCRITCNIYVINYSCFFFILFCSEKRIPILFSDFEFLVKKNYPPLFYNWLRMRHFYKNRSTIFSYLYIKSEILAMVSWKLICFIHVPITVQSSI